MPKHRAPETDDTTEETYVVLYSLFPLADEKFDLGGVRAVGPYATEAEALQVVHQLSLHGMSTLHLAVGPLNAIYDHPHPHAD